MSYDRKAQLTKVHKTRRAATDKKAHDAIDMLLKEKKPVNFNSVSKLSGVAVATLYKHKDIRSRIETLRDSIKKLPSSKDIKTNMSDSSKDAVIASLKRRIEALMKENKKLKEENERLLAKEWDKL